MLFAIQIYCDFYGYSVIAKGAAEILGINLMENFDAPYLSTSVGKFWRRWHISLMSWFKDYLYIPLGGSRKGKTRKYINKMIVFVVSGLWHGAGFSFIAWGGLNGLYQIVGEITQSARDHIVSLLHLNRKTIGHKMFQAIETFILIDFSWVFFRANGFKEAIGIIKRICVVRNPWIFFDGTLYEYGLDYKNFWLMLTSIFILLVADCCKRKGIVLRDIVVKQDYWFRWLIISVSICAIMIFGIWGTRYEANGFIYFQF